MSKDPTETGSSLIGNHKMKITNIETSPKPGK